MKNGLVIAGVFLAACSSSTPAVNNVDSGAGTDSGGGITISGRVTDFTSKAPVKGATVSAGSSTTTSGADGKWSLSVAKDAPLTLTLSNAGYVKLIEQEMAFSGDTSRGDTTIVGAGTQSLLESLLVVGTNTFNPDLAVISVSVYAQKTCASANGATIALDPPGKEQVVYFGNSGLPDSSQTSVIDGKVPAAVFFNVTVGQKIVFKVTHPTCKQSAYPVVDPKAATVTYTGNVNSEAGDPAGQMKPAASFARVYIE